MKNTPKRIFFLGAFLSVCICFRELHEKRIFGQNGEIEMFFIVYLPIDNMIKKL